MQREEAGATAQHPSHPSAQPVCPEKEEASWNQAEPTSSDPVPVTFHLLPANHSPLPNLSFPFCQQRELQMPHIFRGLHKDQTAGCRGRTGPGLWKWGAETQSKLEPEPPCPPGCTPPTTP